MSSVVRTMQVRATAVMHKCADCGKVVPFGRKMMIAVMSTHDKIYNDYYCMPCAKNHVDLFPELK